MLAKYELQQMHRDAEILPLCIGKMRKIANANSNWEYFVVPGGYCMSIAKYSSGCGNSVYGDMPYFYNQIRRGRIQKKQLTKYGRRLLRDLGYDLRKI